MQQCDDDFFSNIFAVPKSACTLPVLVKIRGQIAHKVKTSLNSTMSQERLSPLTMMSVCYDLNLK